MSERKNLITNKAFQWLDHRLGLSQYSEWAQKKVVPIHGQSFWYYMGGIVLIYIALQIATGTLLMIYYIPEVKSAHTSILNINSQIDFGWFIRSLHSWGSNFMILAILIHLFSTYFMKAYRPPRELTWWSGLILFGLAFGFGFSGYLLPWDQVAFFATKIGLDIASKVPLIGNDLAFLLRGGPTISGLTLSRFFTLHVMVLPILLYPLLMLHLYLIQFLGTSEPEWFQTLANPKKEYEKFFPTFVLKDMMGWLLVINILAAFVALFPWGIGAEVEPFKPAPAGIKPEWYFLFLFQFFKLLPGHLGPFEGEQFGLILFTLMIISLFWIPFWDRGDSLQKGRWATYYGIFLALLFIILTIWGAVT